MDRHARPGLASTLSPVRGWTRVVLVLRQGSAWVRRSKSFRRRRILVNKPLQLRLVLASLLHAVVIVFVVALILFLPLFSALETSQNPSFLDPSFHDWETATNILFLHERLWMPILFTLAAVCLHSLLISHKIAGPLYRFSALFRSIGSGVVPRPTRLRRGDLLHPEMEQINTMLTQVRERIGALQARYEELGGAVAKTREAVRESSPDVASRIAEVDASLERLGKELKRFELS